MLAFVTLLLAACNKNSLSPDKQNYIEMKLKDKVWASSLQTSYYQDTLYVHASKGEQHVTFKMKFNGKGKYTLGTDQARYTETVGGDVIIGEYSTGNSGGTLNITKYDEAKKVIEGTVTANLTMKYPTRESSSSTNLNIKQGKFRVDLPK